VQSPLLVCAILVSSVVVLPLRGSVAEESQSAASSVAQQADASAGEHGDTQPGDARTNHFAEEDQMVSSPCLLASFAELLLGAHPNVEMAAFVVIDEEGQMSCLIWPRMSWIRSQTFQGTIPPGTIAVVHTHPRYEERPSYGDTRESMRLRLPFYVLTASAIWVVDPASGQSFRTSAGRDWSHKATLTTACKNPQLLR
jgi:hypothetical protein